jgi:hypothetical protein
VGYSSRNKGGYAEIEIEKPVFDLLSVKCPDIEVFREDFHWNDRVKIPVRYLSIDQLDELTGLLKEHNSKYASIVAAYRRIVLQPDTIKVSSAKRAEPAIVGWVRHNIIRGWLFDKEGLPYLVTDVVYEPADQYSPAQVKVRIISWEKNSKHESSIIIYAGDCRDQTIAEILMEKGYVHETPELIADFDAQCADYLAWRDRTGMQFHSENTRVVNDHAFLPKAKEVQTRAINRLLEKKEDEETGKHYEGAINRDEVTRVPVHPWLWCFDLLMHKFRWVYVTNLKPYVYSPALRASLILQPEHEDLIDALVTDLDIVTQDVIEGKGGGTTILCQGRAGTGKTLTAEVYAEAVQRPLYRVHSGQLGTEPRGLEKVLICALNRADRWGAILLIDEADVFLMKRTDDLTRNAVCGVFLRTLEYFKGLLFLTTNRVDSVDDAIISRCIAVIKYDNPGPAERRKIWHTQCGFSKLDLDDALIDELVHKWPCSGRDIKGLVRLTSRYCRAHNRQPTMADFVRMAAFRGL